MDAYGAGDGVTAASGGLLDLLRVAAVVLDAGGYITLWSPEAEQLLGYSPEEALTQRADRLLVAPDDRARARELFAQVGSGARWAGVFPLLHRDGTERPVEFRTMRLRKNPNCPACGTREIRELIDYDQFCGIGGDPLQDPHGIPEITPAELAAKQARRDDFDLIDVREPHEWAIAKIPGARLVPLGTFTESLASFDSARDIVVTCKMGGRSAKAVRQLQAAGFKKVWNLAGGILRWSDDVDPSVPKY